MNETFYFMLWKRPLQLCFDAFTFFFSHENWPLASSWPFCYAIVYREKGKLPRNPSAEGLCVYFAQSCIAHQLYGA